MQLVDAECTFAPRINRSRPSTAAAASVPVDTSPAYERLYARASERERKIADKAGRLDESYTFSPQLSARARALRDADARSGVKAHETLYSKAKEREARIAALREELDKKDCTFAPVITAKGHSVKRPGSAVDRLYRPEWVADRLSAAKK